MGIIGLQGKTMRTKLFLFFAFLLLISSNSQAQPTIAIIDFAFNGITESEARALTDRLRTELVQTQRYRVVEREMMNVLLAEQGFNMTGCTDQQCIVAAGQILGAALMVAGSISKVSQVYSVSARVVDVETGEIIKIAVYDHEGDLGEILKTGMRIVAGKLSGGYIPERSSYQESSSPYSTGSVTDIGGNVYQTIKIGDQWWMMENLKVTHYRNGDPIPHVTDGGTWKGLSTGAYCNYGNDPGNVETYGRLYNWYAVDDSRSIAPEGWHVPTDEEWKQLEMYLGMSQGQADDTGWRGTNEGGKLKETGTTHWQSPNTGATNESGFSALPGGYRGYDGYFYTMGFTANFWSSTELYSYLAWHRYLSFDD
jgi:uncharacterized protein (TIGR02145 family)